MLVHDVDVAAVRHQLRRHLHTDAARERQTETESDRRQTETDRDKTRVSTQHAAHARPTLTQHDSSGAKCQEECARNGNDINTRTLHPNAITSSSSSPPLQDHRSAWALGCSGRGVGGRTLKWPSRAAWWSGVLPSSPPTLGFAFRSSSSDTNSACPPRDALCSAVQYLPPSQSLLSPCPSASLRLLLLLASASARARCSQRCLLGVRVLLTLDVCAVLWLRSLCDDDGGGCDV